MKQRGRKGKTPKKLKTERRNNSESKGEGDGSRQAEGKERQEGNLERGAGPAVVRTRQASGEGKQQIRKIKQAWGRRPQ